MSDSRILTRREFVKTAGSAVAAASLLPPNARLAAESSGEQAVVGVVKSNEAAWPRPVPVRVRDGSSLQLLVMTLGDVETPLADGTFDPSKDEVRLKDGGVVRSYYKDKLGVKYFSPVDKSRFPLPPSGWCSWYFYYQEINEDEVRRNARWIADNLRDYGARFVQVDDGWQGEGHGLGENRDWTTIDKRFPSGMDGLARYIKSLGLSPGIWLAPHGQSSEAVVKSHPGAFMLKADGTSASSTWEGRYLVDPSTPQGRDYMKGLFAELAGWGYEYFKIDGQPVVIREYKTKKSFMKNPAGDADALYRATLASIRAAIGPDRYLLGCWVVPLEGVGLMNGARIGADVLPNWDGFRFALRATMEYYFLHNVAWYADPDVLIVRPPLPLEQARAWATLAGLTGQALLTSDRLTDLPEERVELLRRVYPATDVCPLDLFKSERNKRVFDLKVKHLGRGYDVVGLFNFDESKPSPVYVSWKDLGLPPERPVHIFDFWNKEYLGAWEGGISVEMPPASCRVLTLTPASDRVQLISTSRHITQGWVDLVSQTHDAAKNSWAGRSRAVREDPYELRFAFPVGRNFVVRDAAARAASGPLPVKISNHQGWAAVGFTSPRTAEVSWEVSFAPAELYRFPVREPQQPWAERAGIDGVNLRWQVAHQPAAGYLVSLNGGPLGFTPTQAFALRGLDAEADYTAEVRTVWQDGKASEKAARLKFTLSQLLPQEVWLSELDPVRLTPGWRQPELDRTFTGKGLSVAGRQYGRGIGMPTDSEIEFEIAGLYETFSTRAGVDDEYNGAEGAVEFAVVGDGKELWRSGAARKSDGAAPVKVNVKGVRRLTLRVRRAGGGSGRIHADWADAKLSK
jgi:NPCBM/NEW2 domain/Melibiase/Alpha galactosidase C-terminal beta sandwich domain